MRYSPAFTLIELIVVLALIGILTGLGYTQFSKFQERSAQNLAISQLKNYFSLARSYAISRQVPVGSGWTDIDGVKVNVNIVTRTIDIVGVYGAEEVSYMAGGPAGIAGGVNFLLGNARQNLSVKFNKYKGDIDLTTQNCNSGVWCIQIQNTQDSAIKCIELNNSGLFSVKEVACSFVAKVAPPS